MGAAATVDTMLLRPVVFDWPTRLVAPASWVAHIPFAFWLVDVLKPGLFVELGTHSGNSYAAFAQAVRRLGLPTTCFAVDTWQGDPQAGFYGEDVFRDWSAFHDAHFAAYSTLIRSTFDDAAGHFADGTVDLLHLDGLHTEDAVRHDLEVWLPKMSRRGVVLLHDSNVRERDFGVWRVWEDLQARYPTFGFLHAHGLGVLAAGEQVPAEIAWLTWDAARRPELTRLVRDFFSRLGAAVEHRMEVEQLAAQAVDAGRRHAELAGALAVAEEAVREHARVEAAQVQVQQAEVERLQTALRDAGTALTQLRASGLASQSESARLRGLRRALDETDADAAEAVRAALDLRRELTAQREAATRAEASARRLASRLDAVERTTAWQVAETLRASATWLGAAGLTPAQVVRAPARAGRAARMLVRPTRARDLQLVLASGVFDEGWYLARNPDIAPARMAPVVHFLAAGGREGRSPGPLFDARFYLARNPDVAARGVNPLLHFLRRGSREGRDPHPLFSTAYYLARYPDAAGAPAFAHYREVGAAEGRSPHPLFDAATYLRTYEDVRQSSTDPLWHYLVHGAAEGRMPHPLFDGGFYLAENPDVRAAGLNPLVHYVDTAGREQRDPHPLFDTSFYLQHSPDVLGRGDNALQHYVQHGWQEGRRPNHLFDPRWYLARYPDVAASGEEPLAHYATAGWREGRDPSAEFSTTRYAKANPDVVAADMCPLVHYLKIGARENRHAPAADTGVRSHRPLPRVQLRVTGQGGVDTPRPTILCVSHALPWPPRAGNETRVARLLHRLQASGYRTVLVGAPLPGDTVDEARFEALARHAGNVVVCEPDGRVRYRFRDCADALAPLDGQLTRNYAGLLGEHLVAGQTAAEFLAVDRSFCHDVVIATVLALAERLAPSTVIAEYVWMSRVLPLVSGDVLKVIDTIDVFSTKRDKVLAFGLEDWDVPPEEEARRLSRADVVVAIQEVEGAHLEALAPGTRVVTTGVDFAVTALPDATAPIALCVGSDNVMNVTGMRDFLRFGWPEVRRRVPGALLHVVGRIGRAVQPGVEGVQVLGYVEDIARAYAAARVVINPAVAGTGLKIKTLEALSYLRPVVAWPNGVDGVPAEIRALVPPAVDWLDYASRVAVRLGGEGPAFDERQVQIIERFLAAADVYGPLERVLQERPFRHGSGRS